ncbi:DUF3055 domain-containing protein [Bacillus sp. JJ722]|uniref:DUF3055 domain-containing protein n=1 Tax=Bacillus sp. JJ722 TaxID=3122973 RepID=UPI003000AED2
MEERFYLYDDKEQTTTRFVSFVGETERFDLAITSSERFYGKQLVLNMQSNRFAIIGPDDLEEDGYLEHAYQISANQAEELKDFLSELI